jgi:hypothetical protein
MASDVWFVVARPDDGAVVYSGWVGRNGTVERAREVLRRPPDHAWLGAESWALKPGEAAQIAEAHYGDGVDLVVVSDLAVRWPEDTFWWALYRGY